MTFKPMTYLVSFSLFVMLFMALGGYFGYGKIADHFLVQAFLEAHSIQSYVQSDAKGNVLRWEDTVAQPQGPVVRISASNRPQPIAIRYADDLNATGADLPLAAQERVEDLRVDRSGRYLYARVFAPSEIKLKEATWLCKFDLQKRRVARRTAVNPILLPAPFRP